MEIKTLKDKVEEYEEDINNLHGIFREIKKEKDKWS
jgi:hypothetical protein